MVSDRLPEWGVTRSFATLAIDVAEAAVFVVGHFLAVLLSSAVWLGLGALFEAVLPTPVAGVSAAALATVIWLALIVVGPAVVVARAFRSPIGARLTDQPIVVLLPPILLLGALVALLSKTGAGALAVLAVVIATFVLVRRVLHLYAQHVRAGALSRRSRYRLGVLGMGPLSTLLLFLAAFVLDGVVPLGNTGSAALEGVVLALGAPGTLAVGAASVATYVAALLVVPLVLCAGYVLVQLTSALALGLREEDAGPSPVVDRVAAGRFPVPTSGSMAVWLWTTLGGSQPSTEASVGLPDSKAEWKYDDADAELAHRQAQERDPAEAVEIGEIVPLVLEEADYSSDPPTVMGSRNALKVFVDDVPAGLAVRDTICVKVTDYGGTQTSAEAVFLSRGDCSTADRRA